MIVKGNIEERACQMVQYIIENRVTVRAEICRPSYEKQDGAMAGTACKSLFLNSNQRDIINQNYEITGGRTMTGAAKKRRIQAVKLADALNAIEGVPVSDYAKTLSRCWANGELTGEQMKEALLASHRKLAAQEQRIHV
jgi:hypothetical protein